MTTSQGIVTAEAKAPAKNPEIMWVNKLGLNLLWIIVFSELFVLRKIPENGIFMKRVTGKLL